MQWSTGNVGRHAIAGIAARPDLELVGVWVSSDGEGRAGRRPARRSRPRPRRRWRPPTPTRCSRCKPDCIVLHRDGRQPAAARRSTTSTRFLARRHQRGVQLPGVPAVPVRRRAGRDDRADRAGRAGRRRVAVRERRRPRLRERLAAARAHVGVASASTRCAAWSCSTTRPTTARPCCSTSWASASRWTRRRCCCCPACFAWRGARVVRQLAAGLDVELDELEGDRRQAAGAGDLRDRRRHDRGRHAWPRCASRCCGMNDGRPVVVLEHVTRLRPDLGPDWPQPAGAGLLPRRGHRRAELHARPAAARHRRRPQHRRPQGDRDAAGQRGRGRGRGAARAADRARPAADHRPRA